MKNYSWLPNKFVDDGVGLIITGKRFGDHASERNVCQSSVKIRLTHSALAKLQASHEFENWMETSSIKFTTEEIYGPTGSIGSRLWNKSWVQPTSMLYEFLNNMGGGVPIEVIREIVDICYQEAIVA
jgi:hypothetical protein